MSCFYEINSVREIHLGKTINSFQMPSQTNLAIVHVFAHLMNKRVSMPFCQVDFFAFFSLKAQETITLKCAVNEIFCKLYSIMRLITITTTITIQKRQLLRNTWMFSFIKQN